MKIIGPKKTVPKKPLAGLGSNWVFIYGLLLTLLSIVIIISNGLGEAWVFYVGGCIGIMGLYMTLVAFRTIRSEKVSDSDSGSGGGMLIFFGLILGWKSWEAMLDSSSSEIVMWFFLAAAIVGLVMVVVGFRRLKKDVDDEHQKSP